MVINNQRYSALIIGAIIIASIFTAHIFSFFHLLNGLVYDYLMRHSISSQASEQLLVIDGDKHFADRGDELWLPLLQNLLAQNTKQVVFSFLPEHVSADFYQLAADSGKVVFGRQIVNNTPDATEHLQALPATAQDKSITFGFVKPAKSQHGIFRTQLSTTSFDGNVLSGLEYFAAQQVVDRTLIPSSSHFLINFIGGTARLPKIKLQQAIDGGLISELVSGRTVLIGIYGLEPIASYFTPLSIASEQTPEVFFHAFALDTLLSERTIRVLPAWMLLLIITGITAVTLVYCQQLAIRRSFWLSMLLTLCYGFACWLSLHNLLLWVPSTELLLAQWLTFALVWRFRIVQESRIFDSTLFNLSANLQEKVFPVSFYHSQDPWAQLIVMINQSLNLNRMIFLERIPGQHRLIEIKAFECSIEDIVELRRDYERPPYSTVIQEQKPLLMDRPYLKAEGDNEQQYLAPLIFAGEVLGFWVFTVDTGTVQTSLKFLALTQAYMSQISEILYYRQELQKRTTQENNKLWAYLSFRTGEKPYQLLNQSVTLLDRRITELQQVFNNLNTGGVLYDLFGRVVLLNKYIEELAQSVGLKLYNMTALDFIAAVTGYNTADARVIMQKTIFDQEMISIPISSFKVDRNYILHIQPLKLPDQKQNHNDTLPVFQIIGILCELEDVTELKAIYRLKERMFERFGYQIRNDLATMVFALSIIEEAGTTEEEKAFALNSIRGKIEGTLTMLNSVNEQTNVEMESLASNLSRYPINGLDPINKAITTLKEYAALRNVNLHLKSPRLLSLVYSSPNELLSVFRTILTAMIDDSFDNADVLIDIEEKNEWIHYRFQNSGIGIANNKLHQFDENPTQLSADVLKINEVIHCVEHWGGLIEFSKQEGIGSSITLSLKRFL